MKVSKLTARLIDSVTMFALAQLRKMSPAEVRQSMKWPKGKGVEIAAQICHVRADTKSAVAVDELSTACTTGAMAIIDFKSGTSKAFLNGFIKGLGAPYMLNGSLEHRVEPVSVPVIRLGGSASTTPQFGSFQSPSGKGRNEREISLVDGRY